MSINPFAALCQCNWETRTGGRPWQSELFLRANNAAGLKKWPGWKGPLYTKTSWEQKKDGTKYTAISYFCKYPDVDAFLTNYALKIVQDYPVCTARKASFWGYFDGLFKGRNGAWATDHEYFRRLLNVAVELAPDMFGNGWRAKLMTSLDYAIDMKYLTEQHQNMALEVISGIFDPKEAPQDIPLLNKKPGKVICLDFGHGGRDGGAPIPGSKDIAEKDINLSYGQAVGAKLAAWGYDVMYTRVGDEYVPLGNRGKIAQEHRPMPSAFLSIHANAAANKKARGFETYTYLGQDAGDRLATYITNSVIKAIPGIKINSDYTDGDVDKEKNLAVLRNTPGIPSVLIELGFLTNEQDLANLLNDGYREKLTGAIADGVNNFVGGA